MNERALRHAIITFYRGELRRRYQERNLRRFPDFAQISTERVDALREFFLGEIYPPPAQRERLDLAFEHLAGVLHSPRRVRPLMTAAITSAFRMGPRFPAAISAGLATLDAYRETRLLESRMLEEALKSGLSEEDSKQREKMIRLIGAVPEAEVLRLISDILRLFRALSNVKMLETAVHFMEICGHVIDKRQDIYTVEDAEGFRLGVRLVRGGLQLFQDLPAAQFPHIIAGIEAVELDWFRRLQRA